VNKIGAIPFKPLIKNDEQKTSGGAGAINPADAML
jgi:hypothetical protein